MLAERGKKIDAVLEFDVPDSLLVRIGEKDPTFEPEPAVCAALAPGILQFSN